VSSQTALVASQTPSSTPTTSTVPQSGGEPVTVPAQPADVFRSAIVSLRSGRRTRLRLLVTSRVTHLGIVATVPSKRVKLARRGTYRLTLCAGRVCITKPFRARRGKATLPNIVASSAIVGPVTLRMIGPGGLATGAL
jgi:hypothetical protein